MCITEDKLVESYGKATPRERFRLIYKNYSIFPQLVDCYETGLFNRILFEVEYNRRKKNDDDLGVRIQTSHRSDPTAAKAIEHIMIRDAIEECNFFGNILKETDDPEKHKRDILTIHMMLREYEVFDTSLKALPLAEFKITYSHLHDGRKLVESVTVSYFADGDENVITPEAMQVALMLQEIQNKELRKAAIEQMKILVGLNDTKI